MNAAELREAFIIKGWSNPQFEEVPQDEIRSIFGVFGSHFLTGPVFKMLGTGTRIGNIYDSDGKIVFYDVPAKS